MIRQELSQKRQGSCSLRTTEGVTMVTARENPSMGLLEEYICTALLDCNKNTIFSLSPAQVKAITDRTKQRMVSPWWRSTRTPVYQQKQKCESRQIKYRWGREAFGSMVLRLHALKAGFVFVCLWHLLKYYKNLQVYSSMPVNNLACRKHQLSH